MMKRIAVLIIFVLLAGVTFALTESSLVVPGVEYTYMFVPEKPWSIHILEIDRSRNDFKVRTTLAQEQIYGLATVPDQVAQLPAEAGTPIAATNGSYFNINPGLYQGRPTGLQVTEGELITAPRNHSWVYFWIDAFDQPNIGYVTTILKVTWPDGQQIPIAFNYERPANTMTLYTPRLGETTRTVGGVELVLGTGDGTRFLPLEIDNTYSLSVKEIINNGNNPLPQDGVILSIDSQLFATLGPIEVGSILEVSLNTSPDLTGTKNLIGGAPILVKDGISQYPDPDSPEAQGMARHPRTIIGYNDETIFLVVIDGRQTELSIGMTYPEMGALMRDLGADIATNLDGGGSSTMWADGEIINCPSGLASPANCDGVLRAVANGVVLLQTSYGFVRDCPENSQLITTDYECVSEERLSRTGFEYGFRMKVMNIGSESMENVALRLISAPGNVSIAEGYVFFDPIGPNDELLSKDTFKIRLDRTSVFNPYDLIWQTSAIAEVVIGDLNGDKAANFVDLINIAEQWLMPIGLEGQSGLAAYWKMDETSVERGDIVNDSSGNYNDGMISGLLKVPGAIGTAFRFDGDQDFCFIFSTESITIGNQDYSISAWVFPESLTGIQGIVVKVPDPSFDGDPETDKEYIFSLDGSRLRLDVEKDDNDGCAKTIEGVLTLKQWQHIAVTFDSSTKEVVFYHNDQPQTLETNTIDALPDELDWNDLYIGMSSVTNDMEFTGRLDEVAIFNRVLTAEEVQLLYPQYPADMNGDGIVDMLDITIFGLHWMEMK